MGQQVVLCSKTTVMLNMKQRCLEEVNLTYNYKHHKINVEWCLFVLHSILSLHCDIFSKGCITINACKIKLKLSHLNKHNIKIYRKTIT